jgi:Flp pilus assembly protein TadD
MVRGAGTWNKALVAGVALAAVSLAACDKKSAGLDADPISTASTGAAGPSFKKTEALGKRWKAEPGNVQLAIAYGNSLDELGQKPTQIEVLRTAASQTAGDAKAQGQLGRAMLVAGDMQGGGEALERAVQLNPTDVQSLSALGAALDQQTKHSEAREKYQAALAIDPDNVNITNNLAMSYALQGKLTEAESILRKAVTHPKAKSAPRVRQNLALVVGLQGRFEESKQIASQDLPPDQVQMLSRPNTWAQLKEG